MEWGPHGGGPSCLAGRFRPSAPRAGACASRSARGLGPAGTFLALWDTFGEVESTQSPGEGRDRARSGWKSARTATTSKVAWRLGSQRRAAAFASTERLPRSVPALDAPARFLFGRGAGKQLSACRGSARARPSDVLGPGLCSCVSRVRRVSCPGFVARRARVSMIYLGSSVSFSIGLTLSFDFLFTRF